VTDPEGKPTSFTFNFLGNPFTKVDARNKIWKYDYNNMGWLISMTNPLPITHSTYFEYDGVGNKTKETDPEGREKTYFFDPENRVIRSTESAGTAISQFFYNGDGKLIRQVDAEGKETRFEYDLDGRLIKTIDGNGNQIANEYADGAGGSSCPSCSGANGAGQPSRTIFPTFSRTYAYDSRGRKVQETDVLSETESYTTQFVYDGMGNILSQIDKEGNTTIYQYDELGRRIKVADPLNQITEYAYDNRGNLISLKDAKGNSTTFEYDRNNRVTKETRPMGQATCYFYNPVGALDYKIVAKNQKIAYEYDDAGRMIRTKYFASLGDSNPVKTVSFTYSPSGKLLSYNDGTTSAAYGYDDSGRKLSETFNYGSFELTYSYSYHKNGLKKSLTMPDGTRYDYTYDANNQVSTIGIPGQGVMTYNQYTWNAPAVITLPGGIRKENTYTPLMQPKTIAVKDLAQNPLMNYTYDYSPAGNITAKNTEGVNYAYQYDALYRLTNAVNPGDTESFTYDPVGNRLTAAISGQPSADSYTHNSNNELLGYDGISYEYDANGNTVSKTDSSGIITFTYDVDNRLIQFRNQQSAIRNYYYDPFGKRLWKEANDIRTNFLYSDEGLIGEYNSSGLELKTYGYVPNSTWTTNPLFLKIGTSYYFYQNDHLGTPQKITDSNGNVVWSATYDVFGKATVNITAIENNLRFPGQYYDSESGLHYNYHRYYDPSMGRFVMADPIGIVG
jgi:large repetitive protein